MDASAVQETTVVVIGAGITGIGASYYLRKHGIAHVVLEANDDLGGTWYTQRWHGARCDSDFVKYSFSFRPYTSDECLADRAVIHDYLRSVAAEFGIVDGIRFSTRVTSASFSSVTQRWVVVTEGGGRYEAQFLINGNGYFSTPHVPEFPGTESFQGELIHSFDLDAERRFDDENVVLVGSGSTAVCAAPELAKVSKTMTMLQRSPSYILDIENVATPLMRVCQNLYRRGFDPAITFLRAFLQARDDAIFVGFGWFPRFARWYFRKHWANAVSGEMLEKHFSPSYSPWEQRIPVAVGFKEAVARGAVRIKTDTIERFTPTSIVLASGEELPCDVCVLATGFNLEFLHFEMLVDGMPVEMAGINFYKGIMLGGVPNVFQPVGVWHSAWTQRSEASTRFAIKVIEYMNAHGFGMVQVEPTTVEYTPAITPNYIVRDLPKLPRLYGSWELPSVDNLFRYHFRPKQLTFRSRNADTVRTASIDHLVGEGPESVEALDDQDEALR